MSHTQSLPYIPRTQSHTHTHSLNLSLSLSQVYLAIEPSKFEAGAFYQTLCGFLEDFRKVKIELDAVRVSFVCVGGREGRGGVGVGVDVLWCKCACECEWAAHVAVVCCCQVTAPMWVDSTGQVSHRGTKRSLIL